MSTPSPHDDFLEKLEEYRKKLENDFEEIRKTLDNLIKDIEKTIEEMRGSK